MSYHLANKGFVALCALPVIALGILAYTVLKRYQLSRLDDQ